MVLRARRDTKTTSTPGNQSRAHLCAARTLGARSVQNVAVDAFAPAPGCIVRSSESRGRDHGVPVITPTVTGTQGSRGVAGGDRGLRFDPS